MEGDEERLGMDFQEPQVQVECKRKEGRKMKYCIRVCIACSRGVMSKLFVRGRKSFHLSNICKITMVSNEK